MLRGVDLKTAVLGVIKRARRRGISILEIRRQLRIRAQQHLDRRIRDLDANHVIDRRVERGVTFYVYRRPRTQARDSTGITKKVRAEVLNAHGRRCQMCGRTPARHKIVLHIDHKIPRRWGGKTVFANLEPLCSECNEGKKAHFATFTVRKMRGILEIESVHERLAKFLKANIGAPVADKALMVVANHISVQSDWQRRLRELRCTGLVIETRRKRTPAGYVEAQYILKNWVKLPRDLSAWVRRFESLRASRSLKSRRRGK